MNIVRELQLSILDMNPEDDLYDSIRNVDNSLALRDFKIDRIFKLNLILIVTNKYISATNGKLVTDMRIKNSTAIKFVLI